MNTYSILLLIAMSAMSMEKCAARYLLIGIDDANEGPETCLTDGQIGCDVRAPCCDGLSCIMILMDPSIVMDIIVKDLVTQCVKDYSVHKSLSGKAKQQRCNEGEYLCCTLGGCYCAPPGACYI